MGQGGKTIIEKMLFSPYRFQIFDFESLGSISTEISHKQGVVCKFFNCGRKIISNLMEATYEHLWKFTAPKK